MNFAEEDAKIEAEIHAIKNTRFISQQEKNQRVNVLKSSKLTGTDTSAKTVTSLANTMIGSAVIIYPVLFIKDGMVGSSIIMLIVGCIQFITCRLLVIHNRPDEIDFNISILRIGGIKLSKLNSAVNMFLLFFVCIAYYLLIATNFFQISLALIQSFKDFTPPDSKSINFNEYSMQWACIICSFICISTLFKTDVEPILKLIKYSVYCVAAYFLFVLANLIRQIVQGNIVFSEYKLFNPDFSSVAGAFALSFLIHPTAAPILKKSINLKNNERDLFLGYILTAAIYFYVGFIGGLTCAPKVPDIYLNPDKYSTVFDCFNETNTAQEKVFFIVGKIVQVGIFFQNFSVMPILLFLTRKEFISLVNKPHLQKKLFYSFTIFFLICTTLVGVLAIDVSIILSLDGAIIGFFMGYGIPIYMHLRCLFHKFTKDQNRQRKAMMQSASTQQSLLQDTQYDEQTQKQLLKCNDHKPKNKIRVYVFYGFILAIGVALGVFKIYSFFD